MQQWPAQPVSEDVVRALLDPDLASHDPVVQLLQVAMSGFGYNFYDARNIARSNDQIVRERTSGVLGETARALATFEQKYRERFVPPASRENPYPPAEAMRRLRAIDAARKHCEALVSAVVSAETPATDMIWARIRSERATLVALVAFDAELTVNADRARGAVAALSLEGFDDSSLAALESELAALDRAFEKRRTFLRG
jgi:hypothetical protein